MFLEIGPLKEVEYTGIAHVAAALAEEMLADCQIEPFFFFGRMIVDNAIVVELLQERCGDLLEWHVKRSLGRSVPIASSSRLAAIFPNTKTCRRVFDFEAQIIHDLSTLLTPQYHNQDTIDYHANTIMEDILTNDLTACVSEATRTDVLRYLAPVKPENVVTIYNAASRPLKSTNAPRRNKDRQYILILGTIEPRKNVREVLGLLREFPAFCERFDFVFLGRFGWGSSVDQLVEEYGLRRHVDTGTIVFPGFVSDQVKNQLIGGATMLIYPSLFEGYGLPIVEAMSQGVPCLTTRSSSMPEVGGDSCFYFDPFEPGNFRTAFVAALIRIEKEATGLKERCRAQAAMFSWRRSYRHLVDTIEERLPCGAAS